MVKRASRRPRTGSDIMNLDWVLNHEGESDSDSPSPAVTIQAAPGRQAAFATLAAGSSAAASSTQAASGTQATSRASIASAAHSLYDAVNMENAGENGNEQDGEDDEDVTLDNEEPNRELNGEEQESTDQDEINEIPSVAPVARLVPVAPVVPRFICGYMEECRTGQVKAEEVRKVISDFFGRNKREKAQIPTWVCFCRKHYQRVSYRRDTYCFARLNLVRHQLRLIDQWRPGKKYTIELVKVDRERVKEYFKKNPDHEVDGVLTPSMIIEDGGKPPLSFLLHVNLHYVGKKKTMEQAMNLVDYIDDQLKAEKFRDEEKNDTVYVPVVEFLPDLEPSVIASMERRRGRKRRASGDPEE